MAGAQYIIGIDLGTTNCTMAYTQAGKDVQPNELPEITQFGIPQVVSAGSQDEQATLPSFVYFPLQEELDGKMASVEWDKAREHCVGYFARNRGAELPSRLIASAKSWLCHVGIDRREKILPLGDEPQMSPMEACAALLRHLREAWDRKMPKAAFKKQQILITVPASFDPSARQLVLEAAQTAGYPDVILLEEPQAAFYAWLYAHADHWRKQLSVGDSILVVDIGGGTTDFSLISVDDEGGDLGLKRLAVGSHLLLGGDNFDLALAHIARGKLEEQGHTIDDWQFQSLVHVCRDAKEKLMGEKPPKSVDITIHGRGSRLIGGTLTTTITQEEAHQLLVDAFIPLVNADDRSPVERRSGIQQIGLPFAQDARISCQLAKFLSMTGEKESTSMENFVLPTSVLFNGGTLKGAALRERLMDLLNQWAKTMGRPEVKELPHPDYDFAVSRGAVYYGLARTGKAVRIKGGTSRSYWIGVEDAVPAVPGMPMPMKAVCVVPFGMEEGTEQELTNQEFALVLGEQATFRFFSHATQSLSNGTEPVIGTFLRNWKQELSELHPIEALLDKGEGDGKTVRVKIKSRVTELGVLEVWCVSQDGRKWKLEFDIRQEQQLESVKK